MDDSISGRGYLVSINHRKMKLLVLALTLVTVVTAQLRCEIPQSWEAHELRSSQLTDTSRYYRINYDGEKERVAEEDLRVSGNQTRYNSIRLFEERVEYLENQETKECTKMVLNETFRRLEIPPEARFIAPLYIGAEAYGYGLKVNLWGYDLAGARYIMAVSQVGCVPITRVERVIVPGNPQITHNYYDVRIGYNPDHFVIPAGCK